ncbi:Adenine phosphoribosyltransferase [Mycoplasmopsis agalactiae]|uniref:Adenine phosphoribosyltransferase n=1 Tax=Mycoplasmopsis agalactiae (strain NCTC 10123 / CIP 59.7 / PG2) TaxID=347257 RepID=APT_MYCAP|nr:adenine phosphoribosyltransferase [Mycoplasmopsis agalactiae]A5IZD7.1 RecName: Full=Adenine phosphoribosyltransferase; Short=APRT [Mycoplasmopsis agalactiae PG2]MCE6057412.1 adenine phosphoribosyltransferase [Mycoplasmopsis agalactiae]MCE6079190.1 adenine phosphoribosyltransferase [Mycoplasmopsis agalactiae]MCE6095588.1 adenine phosphoribosyltransferase [Mycoplasmopsis agalactiae]MCE6114835.1 adenine phosphoribosyltransferase [Mycoplasmopsis agalactiae]NLS34456.1 adenine phosphoribosyltran
MDLKKYIRDVKNFPKPGILFKDISPLLADGEALNYTITSMAEVAKDVDVIVGPDARGFLFGTPTAAVLKKPFIMVRKPGKLPGKVISREYDLEYGNNILQIQADFIKKGQTVAIVDDVLATGGTIKAIIKLLKEQGAIIKKVIILLELTDLNGRDSINEDGIEIVSLVKF